MSNDIQQAIAVAIVLISVGIFYWLADR
ncbi:hypothetical protein PROPHIGD102-1_25 [Mycobacterium phage prophiGD102-1]|nr:hypothetical protein PROPHIGD102-1_25 [Mycobacterium phage prophiGD102-1]